jgi:hypothetical protein
MSKSKNRESSGHAPLVSLPFRPLYWEKWTKCSNWSIRKARSSF